MAELKGRRDNKVQVALRARRGLSTCSPAAQRPTDAAPGPQRWPGTHLSASVCCSLMPTLKSTGCTRSSMPLWISRGRASNRGPGRGIRTLKPSLKCRRRGGSGLRQGDARQASKERKALLASGRDSGLAQLRDLLAAGHRPVQGCEMSVAGWDEHFQLNATE